MKKNIADINLCFNAESGTSFTLKNSNPKKSHAKTILDKKKYNNKIRLLKY